MRPWRTWILGVVLVSAGAAGCEDAGKKPIQARFLLWSLLLPWRLPLHRPPVHGHE